MKCVPARVMNVSSYRFQAAVGLTSFMDAGRSSRSSIVAAALRQPETCRLTVGVSPLTLNASV